MAELQVIPARHGVATFVPAGQIIKIINSSGSQVVDTWAFALPTPEPKQDGEGGRGEDAVDNQQQPSKSKPKPSAKKTKKPGTADLPSQEEAERATQQAMRESENDESKQKSTWGSYVPSLGWPSSKKDKEEENESKETEQQKNSRTWASYFPSGKGFSNYVPKAATEKVSAFAASHQRDPNKSYVEQLQDFSKTPVGAAGWSGLAALTGSGYSGTMYAGYQAWSAQNPGAQMMEYLSLSHSRTATLHLRPKVDDTLVSNLREPMLTLVEDTSPGLHDTLIAACDPQRYKKLGVGNWEEHGSCAENLVLALKELNDRAGLKGAKAVGASITINSVPSPLNLFMNIPWDEAGDLGMQAPKSKAKDYVRFKAERDLVVVMSACPQDVTGINGKKSSDAHFIVEGEEQPTEAIRRTQQARKRPAPKKLASSQQTPTVRKTAGSNTSSGPVPRKNTVATNVSASQKQAASKGPRTAQSLPAKKKPIPAPVAPQTKRVSSSAEPVTKTAAVKKKPRKLNSKAAT